MFSSLCHSCNLILSSQSFTVGFVARIRVCKAMFLPFLLCDSGCPPAKASRDTQQHLAVKYLLLHMLHNTWPLMNVDVLQVCYKCTCE